MPPKDTDLWISLKHGQKTRKNGNIKFLQIRYTDVPGRYLASYISDDNDNFESIFRDGAGLDGSSVQGFADINESDLLLIPDKSTARLVEIMPASNTMVLSAIADVYRGFGQGRLPKDPRFVPQTMEKYLAENGLSCQIGAEVECFIFDDIVLVNADDNKNQDSNYQPKIISVEQYGTGKYPIRRKGGYNAPPFQDSLTEFRFEVARILKKCYDIDVTNMIHEVASNGQIEINFMHSTLTKAADNVQIYKDVVRNTAKYHNKVSNFMPKPIFDEVDGSVTGGDNGSGMHVSVSFWDNPSKSKDVTKKKGNISTNNNIFYDKDDPYAEISQAARYFIGGLIEHTRSLAAFVTPTVNSYYRMVPDFEAPIYNTWARGNRSAVVRVPVDQKNNFKSKRIEFRAPDPSANPYLAFSAIVAAGLDGMKKKMDPGDPVNENIYKMSDSRRKNLGIKSLPSSLVESLSELKSDSNYLGICFDKGLLQTYSVIKEQEIMQIGKDGAKARQFMLYYDI
ncbi:MAG TPA: glutamine synthetase beta-grasp domain-containing protein [Nitrososphaeraceae archaeon]|nr:glutamine synthetase beta-grasp domain-containing protein [Nitrososphaeraceae archaeon]